MDWSLGHFLEDIYASAIPDAARRRLAHEAVEITMSQKCPSSQHLVGKVKPPLMDMEQFLHDIDKQKGSQIGRIISVPKALVWL